MLTGRGSSTQENKSCPSTALAKQFQLVANSKSPEEMIGRRYATAATYHLKRIAMATVSTHSLCKCYQFEDYGDLYFKRIGMATTTPNTHSALITTTRKRTETCSLCSSMIQQTSTKHTQNQPVKYFQTKTTDSYKNGEIHNNALEITFSTLSTAPQRACIGAPGIFLKCCSATAVPQHVHAVS